MTSTLPRTDTAVQHDAQQELDWDPAIHSDDIGVAIDDGILTLSGVVSSYSQKVMADHAVRSIHGVRAVANDITVQVTGELTDKDIAGSVATMIESNTMLADQDIDISIENGMVTLSGHVSFEFQRRSAERCVEHLKGVIAVVNRVQIVSPTAIEHDVREHIRQALMRNAIIDASKVQIDFDHGYVRLHGTVDSLQEKYAAARAAWRAKGVTRLQNDILVR